MSTVFYGALVTPASLTDYLALPHALLAVSKDTGVIEWIEEDVAADEVQDALAKHGIVAGGYDADFELVELKFGEFLLPGFVDTHTHAPQVPNIGSGQQHELLDWLSEVTFPMEARFEDVAFARKAYAHIVRRIIDSGTTTCCYYGTLHLEATKVLADFVHAAGQRAFVGKCNMDRNAADYYVEPSPAVSIAHTHALITHIRALTPTPARALVQPILTPRFAISCTPELLTSLGSLARADPALAIQTHISENEAEIAFTKALFPPEVLPPLPDGHKRTHTTYAGVYDAYGLLRENTVLAHAVHLEEEEVALVRARNAGVSHCPTSNFNLRSGCAHVGMLLDRGIKVGLGTDVSGGFSPSILTAVQHASMASKVIAMQHLSSHHNHNHNHAHNTHHAHDRRHHQHGKHIFASKQLPVPTLVYLATQGGADVCGLGARIGSLAPGKEFDALVASVRSDAGNPAVWGADLDLELGVRGSGGESGDEGGRGKTEGEELEGMLERFLFCGDDRNIRRVYVRGRWIGGKEFEC